MRTSLTAEETIQKLGRDVHLLMRLKLDEVRAGRNNTEMVLYLDRMGCSPSEIGILLDMPTSTVNPILSKARKSKKNR